MKRIGNLFEAAVAPENLQLAFWKASQGKRHRPEQRAFAENLSVELAQMRAGQLAGDYPVRCMPRTGSPPTLTKTPSSTAPFAM